MFWIWGSPQGGIARSIRGGSMAGLREFVVQYGIEEQCVEHSAIAPLARRICLCRVANARHGS
jgi:hypothetical protein